MPTLTIHIKNHKALVMMLILAFSLSPCSVKRDFLGIFDIQHISGLNKVKITNGAVCESFSETSSSQRIFTKAAARLNNKGFSSVSNPSLNFWERRIRFNAYSGLTSGNSPPKYILFKRLKLHLI
ncbi:hypothetical protein ACKW6Q_01200 [Chryseobacterium kwangjuense]|uniref:Lipoprotein n=1 Tax=Chryseobacterium kwangjuense TaxID=267125 RepID=A0ABW9JZ85_9FLAO